MARPPLLQGDKGMFDAGLALLVQLGIAVKVVAIDVNGCRVLRNAVKSGVSNETGVELSQWSAHLFYTLELTSKHSWMDLSKMDTPKSNSSIVTVKGGAILKTLP
jgi:hypothetical protein